MVLDNQKCKCQKYYPHENGSNHDSSDDRVKADCGYYTNLFIYVRDIKNDLKDVIGEIRSLKDTIKCEIDEIRKDCYEQKHALIEKINEFHDENKEENCKLKTKVEGIKKDYCEKIDDLKYSYNCQLDKLTDDVKKLKNCSVHYEPSYCPPPPPPRYSEPSYGDQHNHVQTYSHYGHSGEYTCSYCKCIFETRHILEHHLKHNCKKKTC